MRASELEKLLIQRVVLCWMDVNCCEAQYHQQAKAGLSAGCEELHQSRINHAHRRHLSATKALAQVRKLQLPAMQVNIADKQINIAGSKPPDLP